MKAFILIILISVTISLEVRQFEWAKNFIMKYKTHINYELREDYL